MSLENFAARKSAEIQANTLAGCMLLTMLKQSTPIDTRRTTWPINYTGLSVSTLRPAAKQILADRKNQLLSSAPADFSKLRITTAQEKKSEKPRSPTSITDIICPQKNPTVPKTPRVRKRPKVWGTPHIQEHTSETPCISTTVPIPEKSCISMESAIPVAPPIPETPHAPEMTFPGGTPLFPQKLGKIVCKKCDRLLDRARRCCGTYSVALCIRVEHIPEAYRPRVGCSGAIRAHFPSFAKASRYRLFLSNQMRKKRKLRFLVECEEDSDEEDTNFRKRPRKNDSTQGNESKHKSRITTSAGDAKTQSTGYSKPYHPPNVAPAFSQPYSVSSNVPRHFNHQSALGFRLPPHGLPPQIASLDQDILSTPPD